MPKSQEAHKNTAQQKYTPTQKYRNSQFTKRKKHRYNKNKTVQLSN